MLKGVSPDSNINKLKVSQHNEKYESNSMQMQTQQKVKRRGGKNCLDKSVQDATKIQDDRQLRESHRISLDRTAAL